MTLPGAATARVPAEEFDGGVPPVPACIQALADTGASTLPPLPHPFAGVTGGITGHCRGVIFRLLPSVLSTAVKGLEDWKAGVRRSSAGQLRSCIIVAQDLVVPHIQQLFTALCRSSRDEEADVRVLVSECAALLGRFVDLPVQLAVLLPQVRGQVSGLTSGDHRASSLAILGGCIAGAPLPQLLPHLSDVCAALADPM